MRKFYYLFKRLQIASILYSDFNILSIQDEILFDMPNDLEIS